MCSVFFTLVVRIDFFREKKRRRALFFFLLCLFFSISNISFYFFLFFSFFLFGRPCRQSTILYENVAVPDAWWSIYRDRVKRKFLHTKLKSPHFLLFLSKKKKKIVPVEVLYFSAPVSWFNENRRKKTNCLKKSLSRIDDPNMVREFDYLNQYYCPYISKGNCVNYMCLRRRKTEDTYPGEESSYWECYDPETGTTMAPVVWNPVYNRGTAPPHEIPARLCDKDDNQCTWIWAFVIVLAGVLAVGTLYWLFRNRQTVLQQPLGTLFSGKGSSQEGACIQPWKLGSEKQTVTTNGSDSPYKKTVRFNTNMNRTKTF
jgi:hypothetical protein